MSFKGVLQRKWPYFVFLGALVGASFATFVQMKTNPSEEEKINVFLCSYGANKDELMSLWNKNKGNNIKQINLYFYFATSSDLASLYTSQKGSMDTFLLPSSFLKTLDQTMLSRDFVSMGELSEGYRIDDLVYGELAYSCKSKEGVHSDLISYSKENAPEDDYYIFYRNGSIHSKSLQEGIDDQALRLWREEQ